MSDDKNIHPNAPWGGGGPGFFGSVLPMGMNPILDQWWRPTPLSIGADNSPGADRQEKTVNTGSSPTLLVQLSSPPSATPSPSQNLKNVQKMINTYPVGTQFAPKWSHFDDPIDDPFFSSHFYDKYASIIDPIKKQKFGGGDNEPDGPNHHGYCTDYVKAVYNDAGITLFSGNAGNWYSDAQNYKTKFTTFPNEQIANAPVGAIAVWDDILRDKNNNILKDKNNKPEHGFGHVAIVAQNVPSIKSISFLEANASKVDDSIPQDSIKYKYFSVNGIGKTFNTVQRSDCSYDLAKDRFGSSHYKLVGFIVPL
jgi:surface antigen